MKNLKHASIYVKMKMLISTVRSLISTLDPHPNFKN